MVRHIHSNAHRNMRFTEKAKSIIPTFKYVVAIIFPLILIQPGRLAVSVNISRKHSVF